jgi:cellulose synthase/poly-beta-1,6-N-acetylglucosamine synthase-like glycosyltransferase
MDSLLMVLYVGVVAVLSLHGLHRLLLVWQWRRGRATAPVAPALAGFPTVTVQLPVYNERDVVARLVDAVAALDWPAERLQVQLLDDSTDDTASCAGPALARARARGIDATLVRRGDRRGFKAGALAHGLLTARGELLAIFDADFVPPPDFLRRTVPHLADPGVGMVQGRWGHLNADEGLLTAAQAVLLDGHFRIEQVARHRSGAWFNFNGTAGVWRRACVADAGGWQHDTLTEDLDLSYRAQLAGWRFVFLDDCIVPAEIPDSMAAFRAQQRRWAKGSVETGRKLAARIASAAVPLRVRAEALAHLGANLAWPLVVLLSLLLPFVVMGRGTASTGQLWLDLPVFVVSVGTNALFYAVASPARRGRLPVVLALAIGIALSQSIAVVEALAGRRSPFVRTPKNGGGAGSYRAVGSLLPLELPLAALHVGTALWAAGHGQWGSLPFLLLFASGYGWVGVAALRESLAAAPADAAQPEPVPGK